LAIREPSGDEKDTVGYDVDASVGAEANYDLFS
jgi:hypothetical protein